MIRGPDPFRFVSVPQEPDQPPPPAPNWYPDPQRPGHQRWWDGERWTDNYSPPLPPPPPPPPPPAPVATHGRSSRNDGIATTGYIFAFLAPIVGIIIAIVLYSRNDNRGTPILLLSLLIGFVATVLLFSLDSGGGGHGGHRLR